MLLFSTMAEPRDAMEIGEQRQQKLLTLEGYLTQMAQGDKEALAQFYEATKTAVYGWILSIVKHASDAEDVLQETYLRIYRMAQRYQCNGNPMPWTFAIARNLALMKLRERERRSWIATEDAETELTRLPSGPNVSHEDRLILQAALKRLTDEELQIVMLHAAAGCKHKHT